MSLFEQVQDLARREGASLVGVAPVERFEGAPRGHHPLDFIPNARSVIVFGIGLLPAAVGWQDLMVGSELFADDKVRKTIAQNYLFTACASEIPDRLLELLALRVATFLQANHFRTIFFPPSYSHPFMWVRDLMSDLYAPFSHRHAAVRAGLAEFGLNNLVVTPQFGPRCRFTSVITEAELPASPLIKEKVCLGEACSRCIDDCPGNVLTLSSAVNDEELFLNPVSRTAKARCQETVREKFCRGLCIRNCPVGDGG